MDLEGKELQAVERMMQEDMKWGLNGVVSDMCEPDDPLEPGHLFDLGVL